MIPVLESQGAAWTLKLWFLSTFQSDMPQKTAPVLVYVSTCSALEPARTSWFLLQTRKPFIILHLFREEITQITNHSHLIALQPKATNTFICNDNIFYQPQKYTSLSDIQLTKQPTTAHNYLMSNNRMSMTISVLSLISVIFLDEKGCKMYLKMDLSQSISKTKRYPVH